MTTPTHWPWPNTVGGIWPGRCRDEARFAAITAARLAGQVAAATAFRLAAAADGWAIRPTYGHEPVEQAFTGERDGYAMQGLARPGSEKFLPSGEISLWCPSGIAISPVPVVYPGFAALAALARRCPQCGAEDIETTRVAFANRACLTCAPALRAKLERPGWCD